MIWHQRPVMAEELAHAKLSGSVHTDAVIDRIAKNTV